MNLSVYLPHKLVSKLSYVAEQQHMSKNAIIREAVEEWIEHHSPKSSWPAHFFDFRAVKDAPDFSLSRNELAAPEEDIL